MVSKKIGIRLNPEYVKEYINGEQGNGCSLVTEYVSADDRMSILCKCGNIFQSTFNYFTTSYKCCNVCAMKHFTEIRKFSIEYIRDVFLKKGYKLLSEEYNTSREMLDVENIESGYRYRCIFSYIDRLKKEPDFSGIHMWHNMGIWLKKRDINYTLLNIEEKAGQPCSTFTFRCNYCGGTFIAMSSDLKEGKRCRCGKYISSGENRVEKFLTNYNLLYKRQYSFPDCKIKGKLKFDFGLIDSETKQLILLIEYDGKQHYEYIENFHSRGHDSFERIQLSDRIKNEYCLKNNIPLLRIPYWEYDNIEVILSTELAKYNLM